MGNFFTKEHNQTQYNTCDICNNNDITFKSFVLIPSKFCFQGSVYFTCKNKHCFFINVLETGTFSEAEESIYRRFKLKK